MKVFLVCSVRGADVESVREQEDYVSSLERRGNTVHYPPRDTNQTSKSLEICRQNLQAITKSDEVHVMYSSGSQGVHFDLGMAFALGKKVVVAKNVGYDPGKSFPRLLDEWSKCA